MDIAQPQTNISPCVAARRPEAQGSSLYPNEVASDFAFIPFGGGQRKCVGDQFALMEATVAMAMLLKCAPASSCFYTVRAASKACHSQWQLSSEPWTGHTFVGD